MKKSNFIMMFALFLSIFLIISCNHDQLEDGNVKNLETSEFIVEGENSRLVVSDNSETYTRNGVTTELPNIRYDYDIEIIDQDSFKIFNPDDPRDYIYVERIDETSEIITTKVTTSLNPNYSEIFKISNNGNMNKCGPTFTACIIEFDRYVEHLLDELTITIQETIEDAWNTASDWVSSWFD